MGTEAAWVPWALTALSAGATVVDQQQQARRQDNILAQSLDRNNKRQAEADREVAEALRERAAADGQAEREELGGQYLQAVRAAQAKATAGLGQVGAVSNAYRDAANDAAMGVGDHSQKVANLMARIDAPTRRLQKEEVSDAKLRTRLGTIGRQVDGNDFLTRLKLQAVRPNLGLQAASALLAGAARGAAAGGGAAGTASAGGFGSEAADWYSDPSLWRTR